MTLTEIRNVLDDMISKGVHIGDTLYKICPICNPNHNGSCEHCAWRGTMRVCDVGVRVWWDGSYCEKSLQIVPRKLYHSFDSVIFELWNIQYFATEEDARKAMEEYDNIRKESNKNIRVAKYDLWEEKQRSQFLSGGRDERTITTRQTDKLRYMYLGRTVQDDRYLFLESDISPEQVLQRNDNSLLLAESFISHSTDWGGSDDLDHVCSIYNFKPKDYIPLNKILTFYGSDYDCGHEYRWLVNINTIVTVE